MIDRVYAEELKRFVGEVFVHLDVPEDEAHIVADVLVAADLRGVDSHGVARLKRYVKGIRGGLILPWTHTTIVQETPTTALLDGGNGMGQVVGKRAMTLCIEKAQRVGAAFVSVRNSNHYGIAGYYAMMALPYDMIGISLTNARPLVVPTYGCKPILGTNPIAIAVPAGQERPFVLDMATSIIAHGKTEVAERQGEPLPPNVAVDAQGRPTRDAAWVRQHGGLLPLGGLRETGGHKGYGLSVAVDILSGVLSGANFSALITGEPGLKSVGHFFGALRIDAFRPVDEFKAMMDEMIRTLKESDKAAGHDRIYIHGEIEYEMEEERRSKGIPLDPRVLAYMREIAAELGLNPPVTFQSGGVSTR